MPPTPTYVPDPAPGSLLHQAQQMELGVTPWEMAPEIVGLWGMFRGFTEALLWMIVALLIIVLVWIAVSMIRSLGEEEA